MKVIPSQAPDVPIKKESTELANEKKSIFGEGIVRRERPSGASRWEIMDRVDLLRKNGGSLKFSSSDKMSAQKPDWAKSEGEVQKDIMLKSDVGLNNPNDPTTVEKLKSVLSSGAVNFSGKEKDILGKILK